MPTNVTFFFIVHRYLHWFYRSTSETQLYQFQINQKSSATATPIPISENEPNFSLESFTKDVVNDCLVLTDTVGSLRYFTNFTNGQLKNECPNRTPVAFGKNSN